MLRALAAMLILAAPVHGAESTISVPIRTTLTPLLPIIESQVPKTFADEVTELGVTVTYTIDRGPIALQMKDGTLQATATTRYGVEACPGPLRCISCGTGDESPRQAILAMGATLTWDESWRLRSTTTPREPSFPNRCTVTRLDLDVTDRFIAPVVQAQLRMAARTIDRNVPSLVNIRPVGEQIWTGLQSPFEIAPRTWLVFEPATVALGAIRGAGMIAESTLSIRANTRVVVGEKPAVTVRALPALGSSEGTGSLVIPFDVELPYEEATRLANDHLAARTHTLRGTDVRIESMRILPATKGRVGVEALIDYRGTGPARYKGPVLLEGTPRVEGDRVTVPDLDFKLDPASSNLFVRTADKLAHDLLRSRAREAAVFLLAKHGESVRQEITRALNRQLAPGVMLRGSADTVQPHSVVGGPNGVAVRVTVTGRARVDVERWR
jgi:hypothetical protein